jgi:dihydrofolate synthase/folylpolyglutamate synthase
MNYEETLEFLFNSLPMYQRIGAAAYKADLENTNALMELTDHPHQKFKSIHIAGTNGKGSVSHMLASIFQEAGYKTGLYTSPHLTDFRERIRINGKKIDKNYICDFVNHYHSDFLNIKPSFFEMTVAMAFDYFAKEEVDIAIIETGMGGRLDSTNVISPILSIITNIGFDHTQFLGDTIAKISVEKAGIIKANTVVLINEYNDESAPVFIAKAEKENALLFFADDVCQIEDYSTDIFQKDILAQCFSEKIPIKSPLAGDYQLKNIAGVISAIQLLNKHSAFTLETKHVQNGIENVVKNTEFFGRWQRIQDDPTIICDTGHNDHGLKLTLPKLLKIPHINLHIIIGVVNDKEVDKILPLFPKNAEYYFCRASIPRALDSEALQEKAKEHQLLGSKFSSVEEAIIEALNNAQKEDLIFIGGSTFVVADALAYFQLND